MTMTTLVSRTTQVCQYQNVWIQDFIGAKDNGGGGETGAIWCAMGVPQHLKHNETLVWIHGSPVICFISFNTPTSSVSIAIGFPQHLFLLPRTPTTSAFILMWVPQHPLPSIWESLDICFYPMRVPQHLFPSPWDSLNICFHPHESPSTSVSIPVGLPHHLFPSLWPSLWTPSTSVSIPTGFMQNPQVPHHTRPCAALYLQVPSSPSFMVHSRFTICGDACPLSCINAEACLTGWPNAWVHRGGGS